MSTDNFGLYSEKIRYCKIINCEHFQGTASRAVHFFRIPPAGEYREKWLEKILCHQEYDVQSSFDLICDLHFERFNIKWKSNGIALKKGTVPTIFPKPSTECPMETVESMDTSSDPLENVSENVNHLVPSNLIKIPANLFKRRLIVTNHIPKQPVNAIRKEPVNAIRKEPVNVIQKKPVNAIQKEPVNVIQKKPIYVIQNERLNVTFETVKVETIVQQTEAQPPEKEECNECDQVKREQSLTCGKLKYWEKRMKKYSKRLNIFTQVKKRFDYERFLDHQREMIAESLLEKQQISPQMAAVLKGKPINAGLIEAENDSKVPDDARADIELEFEYIAELNHPNGTNRTEDVKQNETGNVDDSDLPKCEREQFAEYILSSLNQLSDEAALQAMMDIQNFIKKSRESSSP